MTIATTTDSAAFTTVQAAQAWPTIRILDQNGALRARDERNEAMATSVMTRLAEMENG